MRKNILIIVLLPVLFLLTSCSTYNFNMIPKEKIPPMEKMTPWDPSEDLAETFLNKSLEALKNAQNKGVYTPEDEKIVAVIIDRIEGYNKINVYTYFTSADYKDIETQLNNYFPRVRVYGSQNGNFYYYLLNDLPNPSLCVYFKGLMLMNFQIEE